MQLKLLANVLTSGQVPHIKASTRHDAFFAQGFVTAQDRLFHMDYDRMRALGVTDEGKMLYVYDIVCWYARPTLR